MLVLANSGSTLENFSRDRYTTANLEISAVVKLSKDSLLEEGVSRLKSKSRPPYIQLFRYIEV